MNYLQSIDLQQLRDEVEGDSGSYEYLKWVQTQVDLNAKEKQSLNSISDKKTVKRRPKYFDKKEEELDI